jgi:hypothetical protein
VLVAALCNTPLTNLTNNTLPLALQAA